MSAGSRVCGVFLVAAAACGPLDARDLDEVEQGLMVCPTVTVEGIDVSASQGTIAWRTVEADAGLRFAFAKATQGDYYQASTFRANWAQERDGGLLRSAYHFFDPTIDGVKQAAYFLDVVADAGGLQPGDLPPMLDIECPTSSTQSSASVNCESTGNSGWAPSAVIAQRVFDWLHTVETATGRKAIVYSYPSWFASVGFTDSALADYPLYIASLSSCATVPAPWSTTVFWQYSFTGTVHGINGQVDLDRFVGSQAQLLAFAAAEPDAGSPDAGSPDAGPGVPVRSGCGCQSSDSSFVLAGAGVLLARRRRRLRAAYELHDSQTAR